MSALPANPETKKGRHEAGPLEWGGWWRRGGSNSRPRHCERRALPAELRPHSDWMIPPLRSIPNRRARSQQDERPRRCGKRNTPAATPVFAMRPHDANRATRFSGWPCRVMEGSRAQRRPFPAHAQDSLRPAASAASRRSSRAAACGWSAGRRWVRRQPRRPPGRSRGRYAPRLPGLPPDP